MEFNKAYNRQEFVAFLKNSFLPEDFVQMEENVTFTTKTTYSTKAVKLGSCESLDLVVYEIRHKSKNDARVSLSKEAFRLLADEMEDRALVAFVPEDNNATYRFSFIEITLDLNGDSSRTIRSYSNPRRYSYFLGEGISYYTPNKYLNEKGRVADDEDLRKRFSVEVLTNDFYGELSDWYAWAIKQIKFPNDIEDKTDDEKYNNESAIRLITRLMFVWFLKQRHLIPEEFFDEKYIAENLLKEFDPHKTEGLFNEKSFESKYYKAILQNLFFAMLNRPICEEGSQELNGRRFRKSEGDYNINYLMRYEEYFKNTQLFVDLANKTVPFLNGGLFDCLDDKDKGKYYDCFTDRKAVNKYLIFPDFLFFGEEAGKNIDLSEFYGDKKKKKVSARGIIDILKRYNFTVEENTPFDKEVSLDPELLGKVFENLLAAYNPETQTTARKQTGSFYTPREIVQYMVDESLVAHLKRTVGEELEAEYRKLLQYTDEPFDLNEQQRHAIMQSLYNCKILDPACGSGAFPMGILQQMVHILQRIDPDNTNWKEMMLNLAVGETKEAFMSDISEERLELLKDIERSFDENINRPDYARKLYLIENCIYGVDIQPIAIQISKLRFFISLVVDQKTNANPTDNFGIRPLPNLEAKFVTANTLIGLEKIDASLFDTDEVKDKEEEMKEARHKIFSAKTVKTKRKYRQRIADIRQELSALLEESGAVGNDGAKQLNSWDMFDQNASSPFFDPEWMFGVKDGFDILIGNPPYGLFNKKQNKGESITVSPEILSYYKNCIEYKSAQGGMLNIFRLFIIKSINLCCNNGTFCEIFPLAYTCDISCYKTRKYTYDNCRIINIEAFPERDNPKKRVFENAKMSVCILTMSKTYKKDYSFTLRINRERYVEKDRRYSTFTISQLNTIDESYLSIPLTEPEDTLILLKVYDNSKPLSKYGKCYTGEIDMTFCKSAFTKNSMDYRLLRGANIDRYEIKEIMSQGEVFYINKDALNRIKNVNDNLYSDKRIVMQGITGVNEKTRLKMSLCTKSYCANSVNYCVFNSNEVSIPYALALLNSKLLNFIFKLQSTNSNVNGYEVNNLPIAISSNKTKYEDLVNKVLAYRRDDNINSALKIENLIDLLVYRLYGLTYNEVLIVDPDTPITEEEYNNEVGKNE